MTPTHFIKRSNTTYFRYNSAEVREFVRLGKRDGNVGVIATSRTGNHWTYKGFGTIENPRRTVHKITMCWFPSFDGPMPTDEQFCTPIKPFFTPENTRFTILDLNKNNASK